MRGRDIRFLYRVGQGKKNHQYIIYSVYSSDMFFLLLLYRVCNYIRAASRSLIIDHETTIRKGKKSRNNFMYKIRSIYRSHEKCLKRLHHITPLLPS